MDDTFGRLSEQFQSAVAADDQGLADDTVVRMAKVVRVAIDEDRFSLPIYRQDLEGGTPDKPAPLIEIPRQWPQPIAGLSQWESQKFETAAWIQCGWEIASQICIEHPIEFSCDPLSLQIVKEFRDEKGHLNQVLTSNPDDWRRRAAHFAEVCKWLAKNVAVRAKPANPPINAEGLAALMVMANRHPVLCTLDDFTNMSRGTASKTVNQLIADNYAMRPRGERDGVTATDLGLEIAKSISKVSAI